MTAHPEVPGRLAPAVSPLQPTHSFQHRHGTGRPEPSQRRGGLATVVQPHLTLQPLQLLTGRFREHFQIAGKRQEARGLRSQERQGRVVLGRVHRPCDRPGSIVVRLARPASEGSFLRASTAKGERPGQPLARGQKLKYKGRGPRRQVLVNWQGVAPDYQTWILTRDLKQYE